MHEGDRDPGERKELNDPKDPDLRINGSAMKEDLKDYLQWAVIWAALGVVLGVLLVHQW